MDSKPIKIAVHDGAFHPDDVFAVAIMSLNLKEPFEIVRSRDYEILKDCDYVFDVGRDYDPVKNIYDHHQEGFAEKRPNGITYAAAGLAWKHFGLTIAGSKEIWDKIDEKIMSPIDAEDNGIEIYKTIIENINPYSFGDYIHSLNPTWKENENHLDQFKKAVEEAKRVLIREIFRTEHSIEGQKIIEKIYQETEDKRIIVLDDEYPSWKKALDKYDEPLFVVKPIFQNKSWHVNAMGARGFKFKSRLMFPESWAGKVDGEFQKITGVEDAIFCHNGRFIVGAKSKEGAIALAKLAIGEVKS